MSKLKTRKTKRHSNKATPQSRFNDAIARYTRIQKQQNTFREELEALIVRVLPKIEESEVKRLEVLELLTAKLTLFVSKKTLPEYLREELVDWIHANFERLTTNPFSNKIDLTALEEAYDAQISVLQGHTIEKTLKRMRNNGHSEEEINEAEALFKDMNKAESFEEFMENCDAFFGEDDEPSANDKSNRDDAKAKEPFMDDLFGFEDDLKSENTFDSFGFDDQFDTDESFISTQEEQESQLTKLINKTSINKLFRRIAKAVHPDLEQDEEKKRLKHIQMSELIEARDSKDIAKILDIYTSTFGSMPDDFPESDFDTLTKIINLKTEKLRHAKDDILYENPFYTSFYEWFYAKTAKQEAKNIKTFCDSVNEDIREYFLIYKEITSIKSLRPFLEARHDANRFGGFTY